MMRIVVSKQIQQAGHHRSLTSLVGRSSSAVFGQAASQEQVYHYGHHHNSSILQQQQHISMLNVPMSLGGHRHFWSSGKENNVSTDQSINAAAATTTPVDGSATTTTPSIDETLDKLFQENQVTGDTATAATPWLDGPAADGGIMFDPSWYNPADLAILLVNQCADVTGLSIGWSIIAVTIVGRASLFPLMVLSQRSSSRMAHLQPELQLAKKQFEAIPNPSAEQRKEFYERMKQLMTKFNVNPFLGVMTGVVQIPFFMGLFFGLRKMPDFFPTECSVGGMFWFIDLTVPDPLYVLPMICSATFLLNTELVKHDMIAQNPSSAGTMVNVMRGVSLMMIPVCINFHAAVNLYWTATNIFSITQTTVLRQPFTRQVFGIWEPPKPIPDGSGSGESGVSGLYKEAQKVFDQIQGNPVTEKQKLAKHNQQVDNRKRVAALSGRTRRRNRRAEK